MSSILKRIEPAAYTALRIVAGFLFLFHGLQKFGLVGGRAGELLSLRGAAAIIELVGGTLIMGGLLTVPAAFIASGEMAVAYFMNHQPGGSRWPIENGGELAVFYCFTFLFIASRGPGMFSLDRSLTPKRSQK